MLGQFWYFCVNRTGGRKPTSVVFSGRASVELAEKELETPLQAVYEDPKYAVIIVEFRLLWAR